MTYHEISTVLDEDGRHSFTQGRLSFAWLEITQHCNLRCMHCYTTSSPARGHNDIDWLSVVRQVHDTGCRHIQFIGGEPLTHPQFREYIQFAHSLGFELIEVYSNAALLDDDIARFLAVHNVHVATSFYSTRPESHEAVTLTRGSFAQTLNGIRAAVAASLPLRIGVISANEDEEPHEAKVAFLESMGVDRVRIGRDAVRPVGRGAKLNPYVSQFETLCGACWSGKLTISYDGNCYPCVMSRNVVVGNIGTQTVAEIIAARALNDFRVNYGTEVMRAGMRQFADGGDLEIRACSPDCEPAGPCTPMGCTPTGDCNPYHCSPVQPACGPNDSPCNPGDCLPNLCNPMNVCAPYK